MFYILFNLNIGLDCICVYRLITGGANDKQKVDEFARHMLSVHQTPDNPMFDNEYKKEVDKKIQEMDVSKSSISSIKPINMLQLQMIYCHNTMFWDTK